MYRKVLSIFGNASAKVQRRERFRARRKLIVQSLEARRLLAANTLDVQIVQVCDDNGSQCAPLGPNDTSLATPNEYAYPAQVDEIFAPAEIDVDLDYTRWNSSAALRLSSAEQAELFANQWSAAGAAPPAPIRGIQLFFVLDFQNTGYDPSNSGSGWVGTPLPNPSQSGRNAGVAQLGIAGLTTNYRGILANEGIAVDSLAGTVAHEIGHGLGLRHIADPAAGTVNDPVISIGSDVPNLMWEAGSGPAFDPTKSLAENYPLTKAQVDAVFANSQEILTPVASNESLVLTLSNSEVAENAGTAATTLTVRRTGDVLTTEQTITLSSSDPSEANVQQEVVIPAGSDSATVTIDAVDDALLENNQTVTLMASASGLTAGAVELVVTDHETLSAELAAATIVEDKSTGDVELTLGRSNTSNTESPLTVTVTGGDTSQLNVPGSLTIPAGSAELVVTLDPVNDTVAERTMTLTYTFTADGYVGSASVSIDLLDDEPPKFQNPVVATDVDTLNGTTAGDALRIINELGRRGGSGPLDPAVEDPNGVFFDVNGDYLLSALDALIVINRLGQQGSGTAEFVSFVQAAWHPIEDDESDGTVALQWDPGTSSLLPIS